MTAFTTLINNASVAVYFKRITATRLQFFSVVKPQEDLVNASNSDFMHVTFLNACCKNSHKRYCM